MSILHRNRPSVQPAPADLWPDWTDEGVYNLSDADSAWVAENLGYPDADPAGEPQLPFAEWVRFKASLVRLDGTNAARWLAAEMDKLADTAERLGAQTPDQFDGRSEAQECGIKEDLVHAGYTRGYEDGKSEALELFERR